MLRSLRHIAFILLLVVNCYAQENSSKSNVADIYKMKYIHMQSRWAKDVSSSNALVEYPRPQLRRNGWQNLNGIWEYAITDSFVTRPTSFDGEILVPYPVESALSGVQRSLGPSQRLWYRRILKKPELSDSERIIMNFGAVDWQATILVNNKLVGQHTGGYQGFSFDITDYLKPDENEILVKVFDPSDQGPNPHGKQVLNPGNIYYTPSSGIWQTVWLEKVPVTHITRLKTTPDIDKGILDIDVSILGIDGVATLEIAALSNGKPVCRKKVSINLVNNKINPALTNITLEILEPRLWSPDDPFLYDLSIKLIKEKKTIDNVKSYFGMRKIDIQKDEKGWDRIFLNNKYTYNLGTLDQGFWPEGLYTAPTDEALAFDIKTTKSLGFNTIRKHIKIEPERWYYYADKIGILVWQDFVNPPHVLPDGSKAIFEKEVKETMDQLHNHPSIITWVLFNERWGAYDQERLTEWIKKYDPSRIVNGHSGELLYVNNELRAPADKPWIGSSMTDIHCYPNPMSVPGQPNKAKVIGEFGGIGVSVPGHQWDDMQGWGYIQVTAMKFKEQYAEIAKKLKELEVVGLSASIYTQPFDVEGEENGLLTYDREIIKIPVNELRKINSELVNQSIGFSLDPNFIIAANIDSRDNDDRYGELLSKYNREGRDSIFLRRLILMASRKKDWKEVTPIGNSYIQILMQPFSKENLAFLLKITRTSKDIGFNICLEHQLEVDSVLGENVALRKVKEVIDAEEIEPYYRKNPDWEEIQRRITSKYGATFEEFVLGKRMIYYGYESMDWNNFGKYYVLYFKKALEHPDYQINNVTWKLYEHVTDVHVLEFAVEVMRYAITKWDQSPEAYDTYANLLHRVNKSNEAIKWEEKALLLKKGAPDEQIFVETLRKMKAGQPTWPQNN